ncbi:MAG: hypothetical protein ACYS7Y_36220 [Planctomycetota bacterium]|jgi:hypothetical protein
MAINLIRIGVPLPTDAGIQGLLTSLVNQYGGVYWPFQEASGAVADAINPALSLGRDVALNTYADYTAGANWSNPSGEIARHAAGATATLQQDGILAAGKTYQATVVMSNRTAGSITITDGGTAIDANGTTLRTISSTGTDFIITPTSDFDGDLDLSVTLVQQTNIPANDPNLDGDHTGVTVGQTATNALGLAVEYDGANDYTNIYSTEINSIFDPSKGTLLIFAKVANAGVWTDGAFGGLCRLESDGDNIISAYKSNSNNRLTLFYEASNIRETVNIDGVSTTGYFMVAMTWNVAGAGMKSYFNGIEQGGEAIAGTWIGNLGPTTTVIGATLTTPANVWDGFITHPVLFREALTDEEILQIARAGGVA